MVDDAQTRLFGTDASAADAIVINDRCVLRIQDDQRIVVAAGVPLAHFIADDRMAEAYAMITLVEQGWADQNDVARAFGCSPRTLRRYQRRYDHGGLAALGRAAGYPRGRPRGASRDRAVGKLKAAGLSNRAIAHRLGIDEKSVRKRLRRLGWTSPRAEQLPLGPREAPPPADPNLSPLSISAGVPATPVAAGAGPPIATSSGTQTGSGLRRRPRRRQLRLRRLVGARLRAKQKLLCELTLRDGKVVYDLNGIARPDRDKLPRDYKSRVLTRGHTRGV